MLGGWGVGGMGESVALTTSRSGEPDGVSLRTRLPLAAEVQGLTPPGSPAFGRETG